MTDPTRDSIMHAIVQTPSLTRAQLRTRARLAYALAIGAMLGIFAVVGGLGHSAMRSPEATASITIGLLVFAALTSGMMSARASHPLARPSTWLAAVLGGTPVLLLAWLALMQPSATHAQIPVGFRCLGLSVVMGGVLLAAMTYARRASDPVHPHWLGAALGATATLWAAILVAAWCPLYDLPHTLIGHVAPALVLSGAGAWLAGRVLRL